MDDSMVVVTASRQDTREHNADVAAWFSTAGGRTAAVVVDGIGNSPQVTAMVSVLAQVGAQLGRPGPGGAGSLSS